MKRLSLDSVDAAILDLETWPTINEQIIEDANLRDAIQRRRRAIQLFVDRAPYDQIASETGVSGRMALRLFKRALETHPDGRIFGFRALFPYTRIAPYRRVAEVDRDFLSPPTGASGAFGKLLRTYPWLKNLVDRHVLKLNPNRHLYESRIL